jgi:hypothetical protein
MTTLDPIVLDAISGGQVQTRRATPEQLDTFHRCIDQANGKSALKPWTWSRPSASECFGNLIDGIRRNAPEPETRSA